MAQPLLQRWTKTTTADKHTAFIVMFVVAQWAMNLTVITILERAETLELTFLRKRLLTLGTKELTTKVIIMGVEILQGDCMEYMRGFPDKAFDLCIVDPPYGINAANIFGGEQRKSGNGAAMKSEFAKKDWDLGIPDQDYFKELMRVSKNQIVWGANYMSHFLPPSMGWIVWDKDNGTTKFSDAELAFTSFDKALRIWKYTWNGMIQGDMKNKEGRIHPTQKPVKLYQWLLSNYAKPGDRILDTHLGSGSSAIAAHYAGFDFVGIELDEDYYKAACKRFDEATRQEALF